MIRDVHSGSGSWMFIPDSDPGCSSRIRMFILDPDPGCSSRIRIPDNRAIAKILGPQCSEDVVTPPPPPHTIKVNL